MYPRCDLTLEYERELYFEWMCKLVSGIDEECVSYKKLFKRLHEIEFVYSIPKDENRAEDGKDLRRRFGFAVQLVGVERVLRGPCSVLEMMVALAVRCEETIMDDPNFGNRTGQWFWGMIVSLGLGAMDDPRYNENRVDEIVDRFLNRDYQPNGKGGLFTIKNCEHDMRDVEIWIQMLWYLDAFIG